MVEVIKREKICEIILDIGIDGLPIFKSSQVGFWAILGRTINQHKYFNKQMSLEEIDINMITQFPLDIMHLVDLGVKKRMISFLLQSKSIEKKIYSERQQAMSSLMVSLSPYLCREFGRKPRGFDTLSMWKSVDFRELLLHTGFIVFKKFTSEIFYKHFLPL